ncbi:MAG: hypothetical protein IJX27_07910 [Clostridia bacterium]|nr:hypothetical protein [Clostridia bacterium]
MSYNGIRNEKQLSKKRAAFSGAKSFSDVLESKSTEDFGGGCFFGEFADVPENGFALSLNMEPFGRSLETRNEYESKKITKALRRAKLCDVIYGIDESELYPIGNASAEKSAGGFNINCNFFANDGEAYEAPGVYILRELPAGKYLFRLMLGGGACPKIKIYEKISAVLFEGKPTVFVNSAGQRYIQAEFDAREIIRIEMTYEKTSAEAEVNRFERPMILAMSEATELGASEGEVKNAFFEGAFTVCEGTVDVPEGEAEAEAFYGGIYVFKKGACLFSVKAASGECFLEYPLLTGDGRCAIYRYGEGFMAVCENGDIVITEDNSPGAGARKSRIYIPIYYHLYDPAGEMPSLKTEELNSFCEYFYVKMLLGGATEARLPEGLPVDPCFCEAYDPSDMSRLPEGDATLTVHEDGTATITEDSFCYGMLVKLRLKSGSEEYEKVKKCRELLFSPTGSEVFPSVYGKGHNIVLYGGESGKDLLVSGLNENMYVSEEKALLTQNTEKISSVLQYSENFLVFSPHYIRKMEVAESESAFELSMRNFKYDIGCDIPESAVCADDKIIYANSRAGVFYINRFGFSEKDMSRHVSGNIETGENGLLLCGESELLSAEATVCGGKYFLRVGDYFYIWDFARGVPDSSTEKASEERKLSWLLYSGLPCRRLLGADEEKIYFLAEDGSFASLSRGTALSSGAESYFHSREYPLAPFGFATVWKLSLSLASSEPCTVRLYFDGKEGNSKYTVTPEQGQSTLCTVRPEARKCRRFSFSVHSFGGVRIDGAKIEYLPQ